MCSTCPADPPRLTQANDIRLRARIMELLMMQFSPSRTYLISLRSKDCRQHFALKSPQLFEHKKKVPQFAYVLCSHTDYDLQYLFYHSEVNSE
jgi:hypothetical protein